MLPKLRQARMCVRTRSLLYCPYMECVSVILACVLALKPDGRHATASILNPMPLEQGRMQY